MQYNKMQTENIFENKCTIIYLLQFSLKAAEIFHFD